MKQSKFKNVLSITCIILLTLVCLKTFGPYVVKADSGFDGSYGGGSSYDGGSYGGSYGGSSYGGGGGGIYIHTGNPYIDIGFTLAIFVIIIIVTIVNYQKNKNKLTSLNNTNIVNPTAPFNIDKIKEVIPDFDIEKFRVKTYEIYKDIQIAWMNFDYDKLRNLVTDEMFNMYSSQLQTLSVKGETNIMKDFELSSFNITNMNVDNENITIDVNMTIICKDYIIDSENKVIRGNEHDKVVYIYSMTFIKGKDDNLGYCPNCKAKINNIASNKCEYCDSIIVSDKHDWVLSKKKVIHQYKK